MKLLDLIKTANINLLSSKLRTLLTMMAIFIGTLVLTLTIGIGEGTKNYVNKQVEDFSINDALIVTKGTDGGLGAAGFSTKPREYKGATNDFGIQLIDSSDINKLNENIKDIEKITPYYMVNPEFITYGGKQYLTSTIPFFKDRMDLTLAAGKITDFNDSNSIILGYGYLEAFGFKTPAEAVGKEIGFSVKSVTGQSKIYNLKVSGVLSSSLILNTTIVLGNDFLLQSSKFQANNVPSLYQKYFAALLLLPKNTSQDRISELKSELKNLGYKGETFGDRIGTFTSLISGIQVALSMFSLTALFAASFGIVNTLLMSVYERIKEIGLMKALGMKRRDIFQQFALEAIIIGFWGSIIGILFALGLGAVLNTLATNSVLKNFEGFKLMIFPVYYIVIIPVGVMLLAFFAGTLPALKASKLNPI